LRGYNPKRRTLSLDAEQDQPIAEDTIMQAKPAQILQRSGWQKEWFAGFQTYRVAGAIPLREFEPSAGRLIKPDVVFTPARTLRSYFLREGMAILNAPLLERSPFKTRPFSFIDAARIRSICA
jgi:hypothetical protein